MVTTPFRPHRQPVWPNPLLTFSGPPFHQFGPPRDYVAVPDTYVAEVAVREDDVRIRVRFAYTSTPTAAAAKSELDGQLYDVFLAGFVVVREAVRARGPEALAPLLVKDVGTGIYDPQATGEPYAQINLYGKLSLLFPRALRAVRNPVGNVLCVEWEGKVMRFQADRRLSELTDGRIKSLELTEVRPPHLALI